MKSWFDGAVLMDQDAFLVRAAHSAGLCAAIYRRVHFCKKLH